jgi:hypothetical protein
MILDGVATVFASTQKWRFAPHSLVGEVSFAGVYVAFCVALLTQRSICTLHGHQCVR